MTSDSEILLHEAVPQTQTVVGVSEKSEHQGLWSYRIAFLFLALYYIRPQDWLPGMAGMNIIRPVMVLWVMAMVVEGLHSPLRGFFRTAHDWAMLVFYIYVVWNAPSEAGAGSAMFSLVIFYYLTTQSLSSWKKLLGYLRAWTWLLIIIALFGVLQTFGIDVTGGKEITDFGKGRLALGTWTCNNPNALGHTVAAAVPLCYVMLFWRMSGFSRMVLFPAALTLIVDCAWNTQSKGSFLVGAGLGVLVFVMGRPKWVQIIVLASAMTVGVGALSFMPRMESMGSLSSEEGVMGRLMAWEMAREAYDRNTTGAGWKQFRAYITVKEGSRWIVEDKSTHSSYVQVAADLGMPGLFLWLLIPICTLRSVIFANVEKNGPEERCRRAILLLVTAYMVSSWMINREYHTEYYLIAAVGAAFHRLITAQRLQEQAVTGTAEKSMEKDAESQQVEWSLSSSVDAPWIKHSEGKAAIASKRLWLRLDWIDFAATWAGTWVVVYIWDYVLRSL